MESLRELGDRTRLSVSAAPYGTDVDEFVPSRKKVVKRTLSNIFETNNMNAKASKLSSVAQSDFSDPSERYIAPDPTKRNNKKDSVETSTRIIAQRYPTMAKSKKLFVSVSRSDFSTPILTKEVFGPDEQLEMVSRLAKPRIPHETRKPKVPTFSSTKKPKSNRKPPQDVRLSGALDALSSLVLDKHSMLSQLSTSSEMKHSPKRTLLKKTAGYVTRQFCRWQESV